MSSDNTQNSQIMIDYLKKIFTLNDLDEIFTLIIDTIKELIKCQRISIMILDKDKKHLIIKKHFGIPNFVTDEAKIPIDDSLAGQVFKTSQHMLINNMEKFGFIKQYSDYDAFLIAPLQNKNINGSLVKIGVINITNKTNNLPFTEEDLNIIENISSNATIALKNKLDYL